MVVLLSFFGWAEVVREEVVCSNSKIFELVVAEADFALQAVF